MRSYKKYKYHAVVRFQGAFKVVHQLTVMQKYEICFLELHISAPQNKKSLLNMDQYIFILPRISTKRTEN